MSVGVPVTSGPRTHHFDSIKFSEERHSNFGMDALHVTNSVSVSTIGMISQVDGRALMTTQALIQDSGRYRRLLYYRDASLNTLADYCIAGMHLSILYLKYMVYEYS